MGVVRRHETTIGGFDYQVMTLPATEGLKLIGSLGSLMDDKAFQLMMSMESEAELAELFANPVVLAALTAGALRAAGERLPDLCKQILGSTICANMTVGEVKVTPTVGNVVANFDEHFAGRYPHLAELCGWVVWKSLTRP